MAQRWMLVWLYVGHADLPGQAAVDVAATRWGGVQGTKAHFPRSFAAMAEILATSSHSVEANSTANRSWQLAMKRAIRSVDQLRQYLNIPDGEKVDGGTERKFPVFAPLEFLARIEPGRTDDPLLLQVLPKADGQFGHVNSQAHATEGQGLLDPVGDMAAQRGDGGLLQKYQRRVLLITTGACAIHCRYCFRQHFPYSSVAKGRKALAKSIEAIAADRSLDEVILSGGDPLTLDDSTLAGLIDQLDRLPHIRRIRIHTRLPIAIPQRVCPELIAWMSSCQTPIYFVLHTNHPQEIDAAVTNSILQLRKTGATLLNQAVLLAGVNDSETALKALSLALVDRQVMPYYLHQLDPVQGAMHFAVPDVRARQLVDAIRTALPGYAVPQLVREIPGQPSKTPL